MSIVNKKLWSAGRLHLPEVNIVRVGRGLISKQGVLFVSKLDIRLKVVLIHKRNLALIVEKRHFIIDAYVLKNLHYPQQILPLGPVTLHLILFCKVIILASQVLLSHCWHRVKGCYYKLLLLHYKLPMVEVQ